MNKTQDTKECATLQIENIGGINESTVTLTPGITVLEGRNATNRTSLMQGLMAALGSDQVTIKGDVEKAYVELTLGMDTYIRRLQRIDDTITTDGSPLLDDTEVADLFAFLLESNEARRAVALNTDLREYIMRPVDTDKIEAQITQLLEDRRELEAELEEIASLKGRLPALEEQRDTMEEKIAARREELVSKEAELEAADTDIKQTQNETQALEQKLNDLRECRAELEDIRYDIETERETLERLRSEKGELTGQQDELPATPAGEISEIESQLEHLRARKQSIEPQINELRSIISFNENLLEAENHDVLEALQEPESNHAVTDQLIDVQEVTCWTCGTAVAPTQIETTVEHLRKLSSEKLTKIRRLDKEIEELTDQRRTFQEQERKREQIERRLSQIDAEIDGSEATLDSLQTQREELTEAIASIEAGVEELEEDEEEEEAYNEILALHKEANQLEYEIGKLEGELERVETEISEIEARLEAQASLEEECAAIQAEIKELRTRIEDIETQAVEAFNQHMDTVLEILGYENIERIWLEQVERDVREGRRKVTKNAFHLHVVRSTASGITYEDTVEHLSESEREVTGLIFALAGYLAHDVAQTVPFMLLDSLEAIDADRIATLIDYLSDHSEYLVVALLPGDAAALSGEYQQITAI